MDFDDHISVLSKKIEGGNVTFLAGAGASFNSGIPLVYQIYEKLANTLEIDVEEFKTLVKGIPFEGVIEITFRNFHFHPHFKKLFDQVIPTASHYYLAHLLLNGNTKYVLTTNFDQLIELAFRNISSKDLRALLPDEFNKTSKFDKETRAVVKLHGCISQELNQLGVTLGSVANSKNTQRVEEILKTTLQKTEQHSLILVGYSCSDIFDIIPALKTVLTNEIFIYRICHSQADTRLVKALGSPLEGLNGIELVCNTDRLIETLWGNTIKVSYTWNSPKIDKTKWESAFTAWKSDIAHLEGIEESQILSQLGAIAKNYPEATKYLRRALATLPNNNYRNRAELWFKVHLAQCLREIGDRASLVEARTLAEEVIVFYEASEETKLMLKAFEQKAVNHEHKKVADEYCVALGILGKILRSLSRNDLAEPVYKRALDISAWTGNKEREAATLMNLGYLTRTSNPIESIELYTKALSLNSDYPLQWKDTHIGLRDTYLHLYRIEVQADKRKSYLNLAYSNAKKALEWCIKLGEPEDLIREKVHEIEKMIATGY